MPDTDQNTFSWKDLLTYIIAFLSLLGFAWFIFYLVRRTPSAGEQEWIRAIYLLNGVEAIVFAAAGFLFGREVHRVRAEKAEQRVEKAETEATKAKDRAVAAETKGEALSAAIDTKVKAMESKIQGLESIGQEKAASSAGADLRELNELGKSMFAKPPVDPNR
jgi:hypothetical protein